MSIPGERRKRHAGPGERGGDDRLAVIAELTRSLLTTTDLNELLSHIVTAIGKVLQFDDCILYLWSHSRRKLVQRAAYGPKLDAGDAEIQNPIELSLDQGIVGAVARAQRSEIIPDVRTDPRHVSDIEGTLSEIAVPIVYRGSLIGVIDAESFELNAFDENDLNVLTTFADLCASALTNLRHLRREQRQVHRVLESTEARYRDVVELSSDMIYTTTPAGIVEYVNPACRDLLGLEAIDIIGRPVLDFVSESMRTTFKQRLKELGEGDVQRIAVEVPMVGQRHTHVLTEQTISATRTDSSGRDRLIGYQAIVRDISRHEALQKSLTYLANHDQLTDLLSRRGFESELDAEFRRLSKTHGECVLFWIDIDDFKKINDTYGHAIGDDVLSMVASIFREHTRHEDAVARYGGDEFMILLRECDVDSAEATAQRITRSVHTRVGPEFDMPRPITVSVGIAGKRLSDQYPEDLMARADEALYAAKLAGRNCYRVHRDELGTMDGTEAFNEDREELEQGLLEGRFELYAQPILDLTTGRVTQYELLLRYNDRSGKVILPAAVLAVAERSTLIRQIDRWVVQRAIEILESGVL
ncbi:MAG: diguanylate cyclase domain-containing protein, partial [Gammaproteobacteria bacterium]